MNRTIEVKCDACGETIGDDQRIYLSAILRGKYFCSEQHRDKVYRRYKRDKDRRNRPVTVATPAFDIMVSMAPTQN